VIGASDNLSDDSTGLTIELDDPVVVDEAQPEQTFTLTAVLVDQNGNEFDVPTATGFDSAADEESFTVTVSGAQNVALPDQALGAANGSDAVSVDNVAADDGQFVVITPADDNSNILGSTELQTDASGDQIIVELDEQISGEFRAHLTTDTGLLGNGDALVTDTGTVFEPASVSISDQTFVGETNQITVDSSTLQADGDAQYRIVVHDQTRANSSDVGPAPSDVGPALGFSGVLNGSESNTTIDLGDDEITSTQDVLVMIHFPNVGGPGPGSAIPVLNGSAFGFGDGQAGTITDTATITPRESSQTFNDQVLTNNTADRGDSEVLVEDVRTNQSSDVLVTAGQGVDGTIVGIKSVDANETGQDLNISIENRTGFPGDTPSTLSPVL
jgi:hypothetical protein